jgi:hypothetical protein
MTFARCTQSVRYPKKSSELSFFVSPLFLP